MFEYAKINPAYFTGSRVRKANPTCPRNSATCENAEMRQSQKFQTTYPYSLIICP